MAEDPPEDEPGYGEAIAELENIVSELDDDGIDIDVLAAKVQRAADLITFCRGRLDSARVEVERIVADIDDG